MALCLIASGCVSSGKTGHSAVGIAVGIVKDADGKPLAGVEVSIGAESTSTNTSGFFEITNIKVGTYWLVVEYGGEVEALEVVIKEGINYVGEIAVTLGDKTDNNDDEDDVDDVDPGGESGDEILEELGIDTLMEVLHFGDTAMGPGYQLAVYVWAPAGMVKQAQIVSPSGVARDLPGAGSPWEQYSTWWNDNQLEGGEWKLVIHTGEHGKLSRVYTVDAEQLPVRPEIHYPTDGQALETTTPTLRFTVDSVDRISLRIYRAHQGYSWDALIKTLDVPADTDEFTVPSGILQPDTDYAVTLYVTTQESTMIYSALSDPTKFSIRSSTD